MKRMLALLLVWTLCACGACALAESRTAPEDLEVYTTQDKINGETVYHRYNMTFYDAESAQPGTVVRMDYTTDVYGDEVANWVNVYLPYGYDEHQQYDILYFFHGTNETQDSFIGDARCKNALDNMIEVGVAKPFIMVFPTYYYDYAERATDKVKFCTELREDIMPLVESAYSTYAETADTAGFVASRAHRAMAGYSQGSLACWTAFGYLLDTARTFMPLSGSSDVALIKTYLEQQSDYQDDFFLALASGGPRDIAYEGMVTLVNAMLAEPDTFSYGHDMQENNFVYYLSKDIHQTMMSRFYLYNAFLDGLFR